MTTGIRKGPLEARIIPREQLIEEDGQLRAHVYGYAIEVRHWSNDDKFGILIRDGHSHHPSYKIASQTALAILDEEYNKLHHIDPIGAGYAV